MTTRLLTLAIAALAIMATTPSQAKTHHHHKKVHHHHHVRHTSHAETARQHRYLAVRDNMKSISTPSGTWRTNNSCGQRTAADMGISNHDGHYDLVANWARDFPRTALRDGVAAIRRDWHHVVHVVRVTAEGILVRDFNSTREHGNREYTVPSLAGYFFVDPHGGSHRTEVARRRTTTLSARRHHRNRYASEAVVVNTPPPYLN